MTVALLITVAAVCLGAAVGALARSGAWLGVLRTFALVGVVTVVIVQLLPESVASLGAPALHAFALALMAPAFIAPKRHVRDIYPRFADDHGHLPYHQRLVLIRKY